MFQPDGNRAKEIDRQLRNTVVLGLESVLYQFHSQQPFSFDVQRFIADTKSSSTLSPAIFALFNSMVDLIKANRVDEAYALAREFTNAGTAIVPSNRVIGFTPDDLRGSLFAMYRSEIDSDEKLRVKLSGGSPEHIRNAQIKLQQSLQLLDQHFPELATELRAFCHQLIIFDDIGSTDMGGESASCFPIWSAVFINMRRDTHPLYVFEALIHEAGHLLLFALSQESPLVENDRSERFSSPLRKDPRTMDGIYHAAFVTARMTIGLESLRSEMPPLNLDPEYLRQRIALRRRNFADAASVITASGKLTKLGDELFQDMKRALNIVPTINKIAS